MKRFILGVGSQKSGTTWLHEYMASFDEVAKGPLKEYHVWDALHIPACKRFRVKKRQSRSNFAKQVRRRMQNRDGYYFKFFAQLLENPRVTIASDITPSYSGLSRDVLADIKSGFERKGIDCRAIFLMRDPVERCISSFKMRDGSGGRNFSPTEPVAFSMSGGSNLRTRYNKTIEELNASFDSSEIYYGLFEEMFQPDRISSISDFIGVGARPALSGTKVNASKSDVSFGDDIKAEIAHYYRDVYDYVGAFLPQSKLLWPGFRYL